LATDGLFSSEANLLSGFPNAINDAVVGQQIQAYASFFIPPTASTTNLVATWNIVDPDDAVWATGTATNVVTSPLGSKLKVNASASVNVPYNLQVDFFGTQYQLQWTLQDFTGAIISSYTEQFLVKPVLQGGVFGVPDIVEAATTTTQLTAVLNSNLPVSVYVFKENYALNGANPTILQPGALVYNGREYTGSMDQTTLLPAPATGGYGVTGQGTSITLQDYLLSQGITYPGSTSGQSISPQVTNPNGLSPSLEPYILCWQYQDKDDGQIKTEDSYLYHITPMILQAGRELQQLVNRANNVGRLEELTIDLNVILQFLKQGCDYFNSVTMPTFFDFTVGNGPFRQFWLQCSLALLLRSQYLLEAERSMVMQGQSVTLDLDITQYYSQAASEAENYINTYLPEFKQNLNRKGILGGNGDYTGGALSRNIGGMGIQLSATTNLYVGWRSTYQRRGLW
jgi:hypothetical protein